MNTKLQKLILKDSEETQALYWRGSAALDGETLVIPAGGYISFDTYFNTFSTLKWRKYTAAGRVLVSIEIAGRGQVALCGVSGTDPSGEVEIARSAYDSSEAAKVILCEKDIHELYDYCFIKVFAEGKTRLLSVEYSSHAASRDIRIACGICTYKREADLQCNVDALRTGIMETPSSVLFDKLDIYIADNGHTLFENDHAARLMGNQGRRIHIFENKNYGGSGGFTRCLIEAMLKDPEPRYTHVILMDDDAVVEPFVVERTAMFLSVLRAEYRDAFIGGAMLFQERPTIQQESGAFYDEGYVTPHNQGLNLSNRKNVFKNEIEETEGKINYNGWFYCCMPGDYVTDKNLPLPLFLHRDDIEYGMRSKRDILTLNGICVWHPNLATKQASSVSYYDIRNDLILEAEMYQRASRQVKKRLSGHIIPLILRYRYNEAWYMFRAASDFYKGIDWLKGQDAGRLHQEICSWKKDDLRDLNAEAQIQAPRDIPRLRRTLRIALNWLLPAFQGRAVYDVLTPPDKIDYFGREEVFFVDKDRGKALLQQKSYREFFALIREYMRILRIIHKNHDRVWREWHERIHELQTKDFWENYLGLTQKSEGEARG